MELSASKSPTAWHIVQADWKRLMVSTRYLIWASLMIGCVASCTWSEAAEEEASWKYLVERTTSKWDELTKKKEVHIDRARGQQ